MTQRQRRTFIRSMQTAAVVLVCVACGGSGASSPDATSPAPQLVAEIDQLRSDQVVNRVQIGLTNGGDETVIVDSLRVRIPGFRSPGALAKDSPVAPGRPVNLPWPYGTVRCGSDAAPDVGRPVVTLRVHTESDPTARTLRLTGTDPTGVLQRIADRTCAVERINREIALDFAGQWRPEQGPDGVILHGTLRARLRIDEPREVTEVRGAIMYGLSPDESAGPVPTPLALLTSNRRQAAIPVIAYAARCDGHTKGEIKKPYEFLVWVSSPGAEPVAVTPTVNQSTKDALRLACAF